MHDRSAHLRFDVVSDDGQILIRKSLCPPGIAGDENRDVIDEPQPGFQRTTGVEAGRLFRTDWQIIDHQFRGRVLEFGDDLFASRFFFQGKECAEGILIAHVRRVPIENAPHFHDGTGELDLFTEDLRAVGRREDGFADVHADFAPVDVKSSNDFDIARPIAGNLPVHQSDARAVGRGAVIKIDSLNKRAGTIANPHNGDSYFSHF